MSCVQQKNHPRTEVCHHQPSEGGPDGTGDIETQGVESHRARYLVSSYQFRHNGQPRWSVQSCSDIEKKGEAQEAARCGSTRERQNAQAGGGHEHPELGEQEQPAPVNHIGQGACHQGKEKYR